MAEFVFAPAQGSTPSHNDFSPKIVYDEVREFATEDKRIGHSDLSDDQKIVLEAATRTARNLCGGESMTLGGYAGSGKSTLIPLLAENLGTLHRTAFCCFTGKASNVLKRKLAAAGIPTHSTGYIGTIHGLMYLPVLDDRGIVVSWNKQKRLLTGNETPIERIIVDEASMVGSDLLADLLSYDIPVVLVGDHGQLEPVNDTSILSEPDFRLEKIHRQAEKNPIIKLANLIRTTGNIPKNWEESEEIRFISQSEFGRISNEGFSRLGMEMGILVRSNKTRNFYNKGAAGGNVPRVDDIVICLRNNPPIFNGMRGTVESVEPVLGHWYNITVHFKDDGFRLTSLVNKHQFNRSETIKSAYDLHKHGYPRGLKDMGLLFDFGMTLTVHKAQGSSFEEMILCPEYWGGIDRNNPDGYKRWLYTGVTRASGKLYLLQK